MEICSLFRKIVTLEGIDKVKKKLGYLIASAVVFLGWGNSCSPQGAEDYRKPGKTEVVTEVIDAIDNNGDELKTKVCHYEYDMPAVPIDLRHAVVLGGVCFDASQSNYEKISELYGARYLSNEGKWVPYYAGEEDKRNFEPVSKIFEIKSANTHGYYRVTDEVTGDESTRSRNISYCLFHDAEALCGTGSVMNLANPKSNTLHYTVQILNSVRFFDSDVSTTLPGN
jgi:hypothetical protein